MPDIPSLGIDPANVYDPGLVNIENQAYPRPTNLAQALAINLGNLIQASQFWPNGVPVTSQALPKPVEVTVASQDFPDVSLSLGVAIPATPTTNVSVQNVIRQPVADYIVTESGVFQTNPSVPTTVSRTIAAGGVSSFQVTSPIGTTTYYVITFVAGTNLMDFGVDLTGTEALFPNSAPANNPQDIPAGLITKFAQNQIVVDGTDLSPAPAAGNTVTLDVSRHGDEVIFDLFPSDVNVNIGALVAPPVATTEVGDSRQVVDVFVDDAPPIPFIGAGSRIPLLLYLDLRETAFFPADRPIRTLGLPVNVNVV